MPFRYCRLASRPGLYELDSAAKAHSHRFRPERVQRFLQYRLSEGVFLVVHVQTVAEPRIVVFWTADPDQYKAPLAVIGHKSTTTPPRMQTYQSYRLIVGSQWPGTRSSFSPRAGGFFPSTQPCSSDAWV